MIVFDTCTLVWTVNGDSMTEAAMAAIDVAVQTGDALIPAISLWEIPTLVRKGRLEVGGDLGQWMEKVLAIPGVRVIPLSGRAAFDAATLPGEFHPDPADRFIVATARELGAPVVTRDRKIISYGTKGYVSVIAA